MIEVRYIDLKDIERIRDFYKRRNKIVMINLFNFGINVGLRISDILALKFEDIPKNNIITIRERKTGKRKSFPLNSVCLKAINDLKKYYKSLGYNTKAGYIFKSSDRKYVKNLIDVPITRYSVGRNLNYAKDYLNILYPISTHSLRKTWGHYYYEKTKDIALLMKLYNHSSESITLRYIGIEQEDINEAYLSLTL